MRRMELSDPYVSEMLIALTKHLMHCREPLTAQAFGNSLYALRNMDGNSSAVRNFLVVLSQQVARSIDTLDISRVGYLDPKLYDTLEELSKEFSEVRDLLVLLNMAAGNHVGSIRE